MEFNPPALLVLAMLAQGLGTMLLLLLLGIRRLPLVGSGDVRIRDVALDDRPWPVHARKAGNAFNNQFQLPVLFYVAGFLSLYLGTAGVEVLLGWLFVASRAVHATIHVTSNHVPTRFLVYVVGFGILALLWLWLVGRVLFAMMAG